MAETLKIMACHLSCAMQADVDAVSLCHGLSTPIRWFAHMPVTGAGGVNFDIEANPHDLGAERGCERQILPRQTNSTAGFRGTSCDPPLSLSDTIFPTLAHSMGDVPRSKRRWSVSEPQPSFASGSLNGRVRRPLNLRAILKLL